MSPVASTTFDLSSLKWKTAYYSYLVKVELAIGWLGRSDSGNFELVSENTPYSYETEFWRVTPVSASIQVFYGETAWSDAKRYGSDFDFRVWSELEN
jgi:hypothetical protein